MSPGKMGKASVERALGGVSARSPLSSIELLIGLSHPSFVDSFERLLWWLFAGSAGAGTRAVILLGIREQPRNAQQLSQALGLDYTTIRHHLRVLERNRLVITEGEKYGKIYFVSDSMEAHWDKLEAMLRKMPRSKGGKR
jgi:DNA-binding transcriptional ArsR family regulator